MVMTNYKTASADVQADYDRRYESVMGTIGIDTVLKAVSIPDKSKRSIPDKPVTGKKLSLPTDDAALKALDTRLGQEMARCARDYDDARTHLSQHHAKMSTQEAALVKQIAALQPQVDGLLDGTGPGLTKAIAQACLKYLDLNAKLHTTRQGKRLAYGATVPAGAQRLGGAMGDPSPDSVPSDLEQEGAVQKGISLSLISKGVTLPAGYSAHVPDYDDGYGKVEVHHGGKSVGALHFHQVYKENARGIAVRPDTAHVDLITIHKDHRGKGLSTAMYAHLKKHLNLSRPEVKTLTGRIENPIALRARASALGSPSSLHSVGGASPEPLDEAGAHLALGGKRVGGSKPSVMVSHVLKGVKLAVLFKSAGGTWSERLRNAHPGSHWVHLQGKPVLILHDGSQLPDSDISEARGKGKPMSVPDDEAPAVYHKHGTRSPHFKAWFGDWENARADVSEVTNPDGSPAVNTSKHSVVGQDGEPLAVYHGTADSGFHEFDSDRTSSGSLYGAGFYFTQDKMIAELYGEQATPSHSAPGVKQVYLNIRKPLRMDQSRIGHEAAQSIIEAMQKQGVKPKGVLSENSSGEKVWAFLRRSIGPSHNVPINQKVIGILKAAGYDGITHIDGVKHGGVGVKGYGIKHRVWIAWEPAQVKDVKNTGTFNPAETDMYKSLGLLSDDPQDVDLHKAIEGGNWDKGSASYMSGGTGRTAAPKRAVFAEGLPRAAATAAVHAGMSHVSSSMTGISTREHTFQSQNPAQSVSHLSSSLSGAGYKHTSAEHIPGGGIKAKFTDPANNTHTFHIQHSAAVPFAKPARDAAGPTPLKRPAMPKMSLPRFKMTLPKSTGVKNPTTKPLPQQTPSAPTNHLDSQSLADGIGGHLHNVVSRTTKPLFGKGQEQHQHLLSHANPKNAIHDLHQQLSQGPGRTGAVTEQRVPHASGGMGHLYSFEHHAEDGSKHIIHMMRSAPSGRRTSEKTTRTAAEPKSVTAKPEAVAPDVKTPVAHAGPEPTYKPPAKVHSRHITPEEVAAAPAGWGSVGRYAGNGSPSHAPDAHHSAPATSGTSYIAKHPNYDPGHTQTIEAFTHDFIQHHARQRTLPDKPAAVEKMRDAAWAAHKKQYPHNHNV